jgi:hypothetical protein
MIGRRGLLAGLGASLATPTILRAPEFGRLMPVARHVSSPFLWVPWTEFHSMVPIGKLGFCRQDPQTGAWHEFGPGSYVYDTIASLTWPYGDVRIAIPA